MLTVKSQAKGNHGFKSHLEFVPDLVKAPVAGFHELEFLLWHLGKIANQLTDDLAV